MRDMKIGMTFFVLNDDRTYRAASYEGWLASGQGASTKVARHEETYAGVKIMVSTVFIHMGPQPGGQFETMVFGNDQDGGQWRYETWDEAVQGHADVVDSIKKIIASRSLTSNPQAMLTHAD